MKIIGVIFILGGLIVTMNTNPILALIYIGIGVLILKKHRNQGWLPKTNNLNSHQNDELKKLEHSKLNELKNKQAYRSFNVSGVTYEDRQQLLDNIVRKYGSEGIGRISFIPEPNNEYDPNAIKIFFKDIGHIGYVPKERAINIGKLLDKNIYDIKWNIDYFSDDYDEDKEGTYYMEIRLYTNKSE